MTAIDLARQTPTLGEAKRMAAECPELAVVTLEACRSAAGVPTAIVERGPGMLNAALDALTFAGRRHHPGLNLGATEGWELAPGAEANLVLQRKS